MDVLEKYGWFCLLVAIIGEMLVPFLLAPFYNEYCHTTMPISALGNNSSPVCIPFNIWMLMAGILFLLSTPSIYGLYRETSKTLSIITVSLIGIFAVGACILTCFFSVGETKELVTTASKIHGAGSAIGFMLMLLVPFFLSILSFMSKDKTAGVIASISFVLALVFFVLFIMADKSQFQNTVISKEGLWQRLNLVFMYLPLAYVATTRTMFQ